MSLVHIVRGAHCGHNPCSFPTSRRWFLFIPVITHVPSVTCVIPGVVRLLILCPR